MEPFLLAVDIGTSSVKVGLYSEELEPLILVRKTYSTLYMASGGAVQNPEDWWQGTVDAVREIGLQYALSQVQAVGISGFNALVGTRKDGTPTSQAFTYQDRRPSRWDGNTLEPEFKQFIYDVTWNQYSTSGMWAPTLRWIQQEEPEIWRNTYKFVSSAGFLVARLTGNFVVDQTRASLSLLYNPRNECSWDRGICKVLNVDESKLPQICESWKIAGGLSNSGSAATGLTVGTPVIAGANDSMCAAIGVGIMGGGAVLDIGGSAGGLAAFRDHPQPDPRFWTVRHALPDLWASIGPMNTAGTGWQWFRANFGGGRSDEELMQLGEGVSPGADGVTFVPFLAGARAPYWRMDLRAGFHGVTLDHGLGHFARAVMEGVGYCQKDILLALLEIGHSAAEIRSAGGSAEHPIWLQIKSDILGIPYRLVRSEAACMGAAALAALGIGLLSLDDIRRVLAEHNRGQQMDPNQQYGEAYTSAYQLYRRRCEYHTTESAQVK